MTLQRDAFNELLQYASKNRLPEGLKEQMLTHMQLKYKTAELQQEEVLQDLPKAIRSSIAQHLFRNTLEDTYLFRNVSEELIGQMVKPLFLGYASMFMTCSKDFEVKITCSEYMKHLEVGYSHSVLESRFHIEKS